MGPLAGVRILEMKGIGPGPYAGMLLADLGADVIVVEKSLQASGIALPAAQDINSRGKRSVVLNLKRPDGVATLLKLVEDADALFEGYRPGVAERLGFGPDICLARNPRLVYGRLTGWGQSGPLAGAAGHDINYIAISGALAAIGPRERPLPPLNLVGDYAGGSLFLVLGMLAALIERNTSGKGQVVDAAITDGAASLMSIFYGLHAAGAWSPARETNLFDGGAHFYGAYETKDGKFVSIGAIEPEFYSQLIDRLDLDRGRFGDQMKASLWPELARELTAVFKTRTQQEWCTLLDGSDVCFAPVLDFTEAPAHKHNRARRTHIEIDGRVQPAPAPRFSRSECDEPRSPGAEGADGDAVLRAAGFSDGEIEALRGSGALG